MFLVFSFMTRASELDVHTNFEHYFMDEFLLNNLQFTESEFESLLYKTSDSKCVQNAVRDLVHECVVSGADQVEPLRRKTLALKLSVCEFENTQVNYPEACQNVVEENEVNACIQSLQSSPQHWTTYSGNYRETFSICFSESLPFAKDQIIKVFYNVTKIYEKLQVELAKSFHQSNEMREAVQKKFDKFMELLRSVVLQQEDYRERNREKYEHYTSEFEQTMQDSLVAFQSHVEASQNQYLHNTLLLDELAEKLNGFNQGVEVGSRTLHSFQKRLSLNLNQAELDTLSLISKIVSSLEKSELVGVQNLITANSLNLALRGSEEVSTQIETSLNTANDLARQHNSVLESEFRNLALELVLINDDCLDQLEDRFEKKLFNLDGSLLEITHSLNKTFQLLETLDWKIRNMTLYTFSFPHLFLSLSLFSPLKLLFKAWMNISILSTFAAIIGTVVISYIFLSFSAKLWFSYIKFHHQSYRVAFLLLKLTLSITIGAGTALIAFRIIENRL